MTPNSLVSTPEESLLLHVASRAASLVERPDDAQRQKFSALARRCSDWRTFLYLAHRQKCMAAAYRFVRDFDLVETIPAETVEVIRNEYDLAHAMYLKKTIEMKTLIEALRDCGVEPLVLKGLPLARLLYTDPAVRVSRDIDLLCKTEDLGRVEQRLEEAGYCRYKGRISHEEYRRHHYHVIYERGEDKDSVIEIHWNVRPPIKGKPVDVESIRDKTQTVDVDGTPVKTLDGPHALWQLGVNSSYDAFLDLRDLADLRRLALGMDDGEWMDLIDFSRRNGTHNELATALAVGERAFGTFLPDGLRRTLRPNLFIRSLLLPTYVPRGIVWRRAPLRDTHELVVYFFLRKGVRRKITYLSRLVFPTRASLIETRASITRPTRPRERVRFYATGVWILAKVLGMIVLSALLTRTGLLGTRWLDPGRHAPLRDRPGPQHTERA